MNSTTFPNGFDSWHETHFEVCSKMTLEIIKDCPRGMVNEKHSQGGHAALYELALELTNEFENMNMGRTWDGEFFEEVDIFLEERLLLTKTIQTT